MGFEGYSPSMGNLLEALINAGVVVSRLGVAAQSLGYGVAYIAVYVNPCEVAKVLNLPKYVIPVVGLAVGKPAEVPRPRSRQSLNSLVVTEELPSLSTRSGELRILYGEDVEKFFRNALFGEGGFYESVNSRLIECLQEKGFTV